MTACAPLQRRAEDASFQLSPGTQKYSIDAVPVRNQTVKVAVRVTGSTVEARLSEPLRCTRAGTAEYTGTQEAHYALAVTDDVVRWSAYGVAAAVAGLVVMGLVRGQDATRGAAIIGIWTVPLAGIATYETLRERDAVESVPSVVHPFKPKEAACPSSRSTVTARIAGSTGDAAKIPLDLEWRRVPLTRPEDLQPGTSLVPAVMDDDGVLTVQLLHRSIFLR